MGFEDSAAPTTSAKAAGGLSDNLLSTNLNGTSCTNGGKLTLATSAKVAGSASGGCATFSAVDAGYKWDNTKKLSMTAQMKRTSTAKADAAAALKVLTDFKTNDLKTF